MGQALDRMLNERAPPDPEIEDAARTATGGQRADTLMDVLRPVLSFEKNDIEFWLQIAQLVVLIMILRRIT